MLHTIRPTLSCCPCCPGVYPAAASIRCCKDGQFDQAVGVALEGRRLDKLEEVVGRSSNQAATLAYALRVCQQLVINRDFRQQVRGLPGHRYLGRLIGHVAVCVVLVVLDWTGVRSCDGCYMHARCQVRVRACVTHAQGAPARGYSCVLEAAAAARICWHPVGWYLIWRCCGVVSCSSSKQGVCS